MLWWPEFGKISTPISVKNERSSGGKCRRCEGNVFGPKRELGRESGWRLSSLRENSHGTDGTNGDGASAHSQRLASATFRIEWIDKAPFDPGAIWAANCFFIEIFI